MNASRLWTPLRALALLGLAACTGAGLDGSAELAVARGAPAQRLDELAMHRWPSRGPPRAVILALHGFGDAGDLTFDGAAEHWARRGIEVYAPDQRGFGGNASRKRWPGADALVADAIAAAARRARPPSGPAAHRRRPLDGRRGGARRRGRGHATPTRWCWRARRSPAATR